MKFISFDFQIDKYFLIINVFTIATEYDYDKSLFSIFFEEGKLINWDFLFINYIYKRFFKKEIF